MCTLKVWYKHEIAVFNSFWRAVFAECLGRLNSLLCSLVMVTQGANFYCFVRYRKRSVFKVRDKLEIGRFICLPLSSSKESP